MKHLGHLLGVKPGMSPLRVWIYISIAYVLGIVTSVVFLSVSVVPYSARMETTRGGHLATRGGHLASDWTEEAEQAFAKLKPAVIAFNAPEAVEFDNTFPIELLLSLDESIDELQNQLAAIGKKHGFEIKASSQMEATLRAARDSAFRVLAVTPEIQNLRVKERTHWEWRVTPLQWGSQELELTISAVYAIDGRDGKRALRTFQQPIVVKVTYSKRAQIFLKNNWQWVWTALLVPLGGGVWVWVRRRRNRSTFPE